MSLPFYYGLPGKAHAEVLLSNGFECARDYERHDTWVFVKKVQREGAQAPHYVPVKKGENLERSHVRNIIDGVGMSSAGYKAALQSRKRVDAIECHETLS